MDEKAASYRLLRPAPRPGGAPVLDASQQAVVDHDGGALLVLAGPGTGKTTTIVETVVDRIAHRGIDPERVLVLTFSRKAAGELRERITGRLGRTLRHPLALTFHSYAWALIRREFVLAGDAPPALLPGPEQLLEVRRMLRGEAEDGGRRWPENLRPALATAGFAAELRDFLLRAAERGLDGPSLARLGAQHGRDDWVGAGGFLGRYAGRFDLAPVPAYDYAEIIRIAAALLADGAARTAERSAYDLICVDEYQDTDPAQEELLHALAGGSRELIAVGDPDQSIYAFRGADVGALSRFPSRFCSPSGRPAAVTALRGCRRSGAVLLAASRRVAARLPAPAAAPAAGHRVLRAAGDGPPGEVRVITTSSASQEAAVVADVLRRAHLCDGVPWQSMAVLVRSVTHQVPLLRRAMASAGVPLAVAGDEVPLEAEPGARPLLLLLRCALSEAALDEDAATELLTGPLGGADALGVRRLRRVLRDASRDAAGQAPERPLAEAIADPRELTLIDSPAAAAVRQIARLLGLAGQAARQGSAYDALWAIWDGSGLARQWLAASAAGGSRAETPDRDLDAVCALFDAAARFAERMPPGSPRLFLESLRGQEIPGDTLAQRAPRDDCVALLTAHRAKGLEWDLVVVAGVQEGVWPDLRVRSSLLGRDDMVDAATGVAAPGSGADATAAALASKLLDEERRLFYVAVTRARHTLVVTAAGGDDSEDRPSRFLSELAGPDGVEHVARSGRRWLSLPALTAELRRSASDPARPAALRGVAAAQLARLAAAGVRGAHPREWYQLTTLSTTAPLADLRQDPAPPGDPAVPSQGGPLVRVSPSVVDSFSRCGLRWLLERAAGAGSTDAARHMGTIVHAAAALAATGAGAPQIADRIDEIWRHLDFGSPWYGDRQREEAQRMVRKFLVWHLANTRVLVAAEQSFSARVGQVEIRGQVDRLEQDAQGRAVVVDVKTGRSPVPDAELGRNAQLGVYQLAAQAGAFERFGLTEPGGAELVQVGEASFRDRVREQRQPALPDDPEPQWASDLVQTVAAGMAGSAFEAKANPGCRVCPVKTSCPVHPEGDQVSDAR